MNLMPNSLLTNVLDMTKVDPTTSVNCGGSSQSVSTQNDSDRCSNEEPICTSSNNIASIDGFLSSRNMCNQIISNTRLPLGAQIFTIPASLATFPNSDLVPVFINSLGQMVLANTGNILANSLASLATTLSSIQQLSANRDSNLMSMNQVNSPNTGILEHMIQQYQQLQLLKTPFGHQSWTNGFQHPTIPQNSSFLDTTVSSSNNSTMKPVDKIHVSLPSQIIINCNANTVHNEKLSTGNTSFSERTVDNKSPSANSSISSRSVGNKICQMIDISHDYILSQEDHLVKEKAVELLRNSHNHKNFINSFNAEKSEQNNQNVTVDGVDLGEIKEFARNFKIKRLSMGLTQSQVGQALTSSEGPAYSQSAICRFEKLDLTPKSAQKIKPMLEKWIKESEEKYLSGSNSVDDGSGSDINKKRKRRTSFTPQALEVLNIHFEKKSHPTGSEMRALANDLNYDREVIRVWFCNKRQALKNSVKRKRQCSSNGDSNNTHISPQIPKISHQCNMLSNDFRIFKNEPQIFKLSNNTSNANSNETDKNVYHNLEKSPSNIESREIPCIPNHTAPNDYHLSNPK